MLVFDKLCAAIQKLQAAAEQQLDQAEAHYRRTLGADNPLLLWLEVSHNPPLWLHFLLWVPLTLGLSLTALRLIKGVLITLQYRNKAAEGRLDRPL